MASLTIEDFGIGRYMTLTGRDVRARFAAFKRLAGF
jgi:hypothetical protein